MARKGGNPGNKGGGRKSQKVEMAFFDALDKALPRVVTYCNKIIDKAETLDDQDTSRMNDLEKKMHKETVKDYHNIAMKASQTLMSKAPQRVQGTGDDGAILIKNIKLDV